MQLMTVGRKKVERKDVQNKQPLELLIKKSITNYSVRGYKNTLNSVNKRIRAAESIEQRKAFWCKEVIVTDHALIRWNERVGGEYFHTTKELTKVLKPVFSTSVKRYEILEEPSKEFDTHLIELDRDIICSVIFDGNKVVICSFFGRVSVQPSLANWWNLRTYLHCKLKNEDKVNLTLDAEVLKQQELPAMPIEHTVIRLANRQLTLEKYFVQEQKESIYVLFTQQTDSRGYVNSNQLQRLFINTKSFLYNPKNEIPMIILRTLEAMGETNFVNQYLIQRKNFNEKQVLVN